MDTRHTRARELMSAANYKKIAQHKLSNGSDLVFYSGAKGTVICQFWHDGGGVSIYADWPLGNTWEETEIALR